MLSDYISVDRHVTKLVFLGVLLSDHSGGLLGHVTNAGTGEANIFKLSVAIGLQFPEDPAITRPSPTKVRHPFDELNHS